MQQKFLKMTPTAFASWHKVLKILLFPCEELQQNTIINTFEVHVGGEISYDTFTFYSQNKKTEELSKFMLNGK